VLPSQTYATAYGVQVHTYLAKKEVLDEVLLEAI
jgi:hypothetical protein